MSSGSDFKAKAVLREGGGSAFAKYRALCYGDRGLGYILWSELLQLTISLLPGALGLLLRGLFYPSLFKHCGAKVIFGKGLTLRHAHKISLGDRVVLDDGAVLDAKGETNAGITVGSGVFVGRNTIIYCKNGDIVLEDGVNISANCQVFSCNRLTVGAQTVIGAFTYLLSGGEYDYRNPAPFSEQTGMETKGPLTIGPGCWLGAHVVVADAACIGARCVIGAGAVVVKPIPDRMIAVGVPAKPVQPVPS